MNIEDQVYQSSYEETIKRLELCEGNQSFNIETIKEELNSLYLYEGLDGEGRGGIKNAEITGAISAYQVFIHNYLKEK